MVLFFRIKRISVMEIRLIGSGCNALKNPANFIALELARLPEGGELVVETDDVRWTKALAAMLAALGYCASLELGEVARLVVRRPAARGGGACGS